MSMAFGSLRNSLEDLQAFHDVWPERQLPRGKSGYQPACRTPSPLRNRYRVRSLPALQFEERYQEPL